MACHLRFTIFCVLFFGCCGFVLSLMLLAPFDFSSKWSEKYAIEKAIMIGLPCLGAVSGLITARRDIHRESSRISASSEQSNGRNSPERPKPRAVPHPHPVLPPTHAGIPDLEAQVIANGQRTSDILNLSISHPAAPAPAAHNSSSRTIDSLRSSDSSTSLPPYTAEDPETPAVPTPSYSPHDRLSRPTRETGPYCQLCQTRHSKPPPETRPYCQLCRTRHSEATNVNHSG